MINLTIAVILWLTIIYGFLSFLFVLIIRIIVDDEFFKEVLLDATEWNEAISLIVVAAASAWFICARISTCTRVSSIRYRTSWQDGGFRVRARFPVVQCDTITSKTAVFLLTQLAHLYQSNIWLLSEVDVYWVWSMCAFTDRAMGTSEWLIHGWLERVVLGLSLIVYGLSRIPWTG